jgi:hypothetical protein
MHIMRPTCFIVLDQFWLWSMQGSLKSIYECIKAFSETDFTEDLKKFEFRPWYSTARTIRSFWSKIRRKNQPN